MKEIENTQPQVEEYRNLSKEFMGELKSVLQKEIKQNGIVSAVDICADTAQTLTKQFGEKHNLIIKRVSTKNRNPQNIPDDFEKAAIEKFENMIDDGSLKKSSDFLEVLNSDGIKTVRYAKPIVTDGICLSCHGNDKTISKEVKDVIEKRYPNDKAVGFAIGDLRGIISISKEIK